MSQIRFVPERMYLFLKGEYEGKIGYIFKDPTGSFFVTFMEDGDLSYFPIPGSYQKGDVRPLGTLSTVLSQDSKALSKGVKCRILSVYTSDIAGIIGRNLTVESVNPWRNTASFSDGEVTYLMVRLTDIKHLRVLGKGGV